MIARNPSVIYSTFWRRVGAQLLDIVVLLPVIALSIALNGLGRRAYVVTAVCMLFFNLWYRVFFVKRFGGTPGKLLVGMRIVQVNGFPVGYQQALLRYIVDLMLSIGVSIALIAGALAMTDADYALSNWHHRNAALLALAPNWYPWLSGLIQLWVLVLLIVMLTNSERRTTHDFIAGTVVIQKARSPDASDAAPEPPPLPTD